MSFATPHHTFHLPATVGNSQFSYSAQCLNTSKFYIILYIYILLHINIYIHTHTCLYRSIENNDISLFNISVCAIVVHLCVYVCVYVWVYEYDTACLTLYLLFSLVFPIIGPPTYISVQSRADILPMINITA